MAIIHLAIRFLGTEETLNTFTGETLSEYIQQRYIPENIVISVAGNIDEDFYSRGWKSILVILSSC